MSKLAAFAVAFIATLAVTLVPLAASDRLSPLLIKAETGTPSFEYNVLPGIQAIAPNLLEIALNPIELTLTCGWHRVCTKSDDGGGLDIDQDAGSPVYLVVEAVKGEIELEAQPRYIGNDGCKKIEVNIFRKDTAEIVTKLRYTHVIPTQLPSVIEVSQRTGSYTIEEIAKVAEKSVGQDCGRRNRRVLDQSREEGDRNV